jgi:hypothetical protein
MPADGAETWACAESGIRVTIDKITHSAVLKKVMATLPKFSQVYYKCDNSARFHARPLVSFNASEDVEVAEPTAMCTIPGGIAT